VFLAGLSCLVAVTCVVASAYRLRHAVSLTSLDPGLLLDALKSDDSRRVCANLQEGTPGVDSVSWESELMAAFAESDARARDARVNEQLTELDGRAQRWARIPRVCASVATSAGFLLASIALVQGLSVPAEAGPVVSGATTVVGALNTLAIGIAGASFCYAVHVRARRLVRKRLAAVDRLILRLEAVATEARGSAPGRS
jgi:hypothetical protein